MNLVRLPDRTLTFDWVLIMGIVNVTPDSFYDRGRYRSHEAALAHARDLLNEGADILDVGGEKAGPGEPVSVQAEIERVVPVIEALRRETDAVISVDTFKPEVARAAVEAGAGIINSIGGFDDPAIRRVAAETGAAAVVMHIQGQPRVANPQPQYGDVVEEVLASLRARVDACLRSGIEPERIIIDPGPGFGKSAAHDLTLMRALGRFTAEPYPVLLAVSRKPFIGAVLGTDVEERLEGSLAVAVWGALQGVRIIRTHDVQATVRAVRMAEAVLHGPPAGAAT